MKIFLLTTLSILSLTTACGQVGVRGDVKKEQAPVDPKGPGQPTPNEKSKDQTGDVGETISIPTDITGALLVCENFESNVEISLDVSCFFQNDKLQKVPGSLLSAKQNFGYFGALDNVISVEILPPSPGYEVTYRFRGAGFPAMQTASRSLGYQVKFIDLVNGGGDLSVETQGSVAIKPETPRFVRDVNTDTNNNGACDVDEKCIYAGAGLMWFRDMAVLKGHNEAQSFCEGFTEGYDDYRLPTENEMKMAVAKGISSVGSDAQLAIKDAPMWTFQADTALQNFVAVNLVSGAVTQLAEATKTRSVCVRTISVK